MTCWLKDASMKKIIAIKLPCSVSLLEKAVLRAANVGHWHDAEVRVDESNRLVVYHGDNSVTVHNVCQEK